MRSLPVSSPLFRLPIRLCHIPHIPVRHQISRLIKLREPTSYTGEDAFVAAPVSLACIVDPDQAAELGSINGDDGTVATAVAVVAIWEDDVVPGLQEIVCSLEHHIHDQRLVPLHG